MNEIIRVEDLTKTFPGVLAVDKVSFGLNEGEVLALLGENGAGKSTLIKMIGGVLKSDSGRIVLGGKEYQFHSAYDAMCMGVGVVYQELSIVGSISIAENIFMNRQPVSLLNQIRWKNLYLETDQLLKKFNLEFNPKMLAKNLSIENQQMLEILKAISANPKVLCLDEPTSSLTEKGIKLLFENIYKLKKEGLSFIYITHKLAEVFEIADRVMVMRDGRHIDTKAKKHVTENDLISMMVGREIKDLYGSGSDKHIVENKPFFKVEKFSKKGCFEDINFSLKKGEILGFYGLIGAGRTDLALTIFGYYQCDKGKIFINGKESKIHSPADAINNGISYLTEDRIKLGLYLRSTIKDNVIAPSLKNFRRLIDIIDKKKIDRYAEHLKNEYRILTPSINQKVMNLSGGNQQKCLLSTWLGIKPHVIILDEPTRGIDVGARSEIYEKIRQYSAQGKGVIVISSDLPEIIGLCDRVLVMRQGKITGEVSRKDFSEETIISYAAGIDPNSKRVVKSEQY
ncbi:MAG: sugar ABC transporter ATP-binding protein [Actinobacteria bacterium]|nr:sugar ABC transporter ATP-binding protein [Actinomycetota bacterium]